MRPYARLAIIVLGVLLGAYFLTDDTPADWLVRLAFAGAFTAGIGVVLYAISAFVDRNV